MHGPRKQLRQTVIDYTIAALGAVVFVCLLGWGFKPKQRVTDSQKKRERIIMLSLNKQECRKPHRVLIAYIEIDDPAEIPMPADVGPNREYTTRTGYDRDFEYVAQRDHYVPLNPKLENEAPITLAVRPLYAPTQDDDVLIKNAQLSQAPILPVPPALPKPKPEIVWTDLTGKPISPPLPKQTVQSLGDASRAISGPTELTSIPPPISSGPLSLLPRVQVQTSCGNPDLDRAAVRHLSRYLASLRTRQNDREWIRWYRASRSVRVVWRHVPGITYKKSIEQPVPPPAAIEK